MSDVRHKFKLHLVQYIFVWPEQFGNLHLPFELRLGQWSAKSNLVSLGRANDAFGFILLAWIKDSIDRRPRAAAWTDLKENRVSAISNLKSIIWCVCNAAGICWFVYKKIHAVTHVMSNKWKKILFVHFRLFIVILCRPIRLSIRSTPPIWRLYSFIISGHGIIFISFFFLSYLFTVCGGACYWLFECGFVPTYVETRLTIRLSFHDNDVTSMPWIDATNFWLVSRSYLSITFSSGYLQFLFLFRRTVPIGKTPWVLKYNRRWTVVK